MQIARVSVENSRADLRARNYSGMLPGGRHESRRNLYGPNHLLQTR